MDGLESLGMLTMLRTYSRDGENWAQICDRYLDFMRKEYPSQKRNIKIYSHALKNKLCVPSMRLMQFAGETAHKEHLRGYNCAFLAPIDFKDFGDLCYLLAVGAGVGVSVESKYVSQLPPIGEEREEKVIIGDSKEDWADSFISLLSNPLIEFDYSLIRPKGAPLSSGGSASGPEPLKEAHKEIRRIIKGKKNIESIDVADIACLIANCIVSGGSRRSALIMLFDSIDTKMLKFKADNWWNDTPWRGKANISATDIKNTHNVESVIDLALNSNWGEPGIMLKTATNGNQGVNPCQPSFAKVFEKTKGLCTFADIDVGSEIWDGKKFVKVLKKWSTGVKPVYEYSTTKGSFVGTENHPVMSEGKLIEVKDAKFLDDACGPNEIIWTMSRGDHEVFDITVDSDEHLYWTNNCIVHNCGEVSLCNHSLCNLSEVIVSNCQDEDDFYYACKASSYFGTLQAGLTKFNYLKEDWSIVAKEEALIGVSLTGQAMKPKLITPEVLQKGANYVNMINLSISNEIGINPAKRTTCVKPSGTVSAVMGSTSGIHAAYADRTIRRVRVTKATPLGKKLIELYGISNFSPTPDAFGNIINKPTCKHSFIVHEAFGDKDIVLQFPCRFEGAIYREDETPVKLLERMKVVYDNWILKGHHEGEETNNVSITVEYKESDKEELKRWMLDNQDSYRGISLLPYNGGNYPLAPFEEVSEEEFKKYEENFPNIDFEALGIKGDIQGTSACSGGQCEIT